MQLWGDDELQPVERRVQRPHVALELLERRRRIAGHARRLQAGDEQGAHRAILRRFGGAGRRGKRKAVSGYVFGRGSNVLEYWLRNAEGFAVRSGGARVGVVYGVVVDPVDGRASALVLRSPFLHRRRVVLARTVEAVDPEERLLELEPEKKHGPSRMERLEQWSDEL